MGMTGVDSASDAWYPIRQKINEVRRESFATYGSTESYPSPNPGTLTKPITKRKRAESARDGEDHDVEELPALKRSRYRPLRPKFFNSVANTLDTTSGYTSDTEEPPSPRRNRQCTSKSEFVNNVTGPLVTERPYTKVPLIVAAQVDTKSTVGTTKGKTATGEGDNTGIERGGQAGLQ